MSEILAEAVETRPRRFRPYPKYRHSSVEWLGEIPADWEVKRLKYSVQFRGGGTPTKDNVEYWRGDIPWVSPKDMKVSVIADTEDKITAEAVRESATKIVPGGAVLIVVRSGILTHTIPVAIAGGELTINQDLKALIPGPDINSVYLMYLISGMQREFLSEWKKEGATVESLELDLIADTSMPLPGVPEQRAIANFLDCETAKIDGLVARKERLIELLKEKRTALITRAVTSGLDPDVPLKDSGEWLGEVPAHWEVQRTKQVARLESGHTPSRQSPEYWQDCSIPWFTLADVWQIRDGCREYVTETAELVSEMGLANSAARLLPKGTVMVSRTASVGFSAIMGVDMATTQDFVNWVCSSQVQPEYLLYVFRAMGPEFRRLTMGSTHQTIYMPDVGRFSTPVPPIEEQAQIIEFIRAETAKIDALITKVREAIDLLKEFRTALISAAVTGKIDVRAEAA